MKTNINKVPGSMMLLIAITLAFSSNAQTTKTSKPNIVIIYADDLGYGDISAYGGNVKTPNIDRLASQGLSFTNGHSTSATCTPSRYSLLTGKYAWRKQGTGVAPGNAPLILDPEKNTIADVLGKAGYKSAVVGKWHLGLGPKEGADWNGDIKPGPLELGFNYSYILPATGDRVPCVYVENHRIVNLDPKDPIHVSYLAPIANEPTGLNNPELLRVQSSHGHNQAIVNGIGRIGYMTGGKSALWTDEDIAAVLALKASKFIENNKNQPFFLYLATHDIHVPRVPNSKFLGKSGLGVRGDAILQLDWTVGQVTKTLDSLGLSKNTLVIFSSDNGPVLDDGYVDEAIEKLGTHKPAGPLRGGKYSLFDGGTRVPLIVKWPAAIAAGSSSDALISQVDFFASLAALTGQKPGAGDAPDSQNIIDALTGKSKSGRSWLIAHAGTLSITKGDWKYIEPAKGNAAASRHKELGKSAGAQLYNLKNDLAETRNLADENPELVKTLAAELEKVKSL
ncbi:arylsulfatase A-like enzyme [Pedobacter sp. AK017]|uniref:sulfatase family protein n=1 Tax=Pedobacter sp. AK017 TaxID=2723073 RepID=UPI00160A2F7B|nr:arylsulfatase [Pedobacter sp. AK017]MBB5440340.1 arylsulfatase A-like enzyme [Pedobacter sp. AK017]